MCLRIKCSGICCCVNGQKVADISGDSSWTALSWWRLHHDHLKQWELLAHWHNIISQKNQAFSKYCCDLMSHTVCLFTHYGDMKLTTIFVFTNLQSVRNRKYVTVFHKWSCLLFAYFTNDKICPMFTYSLAICTEEQRKTVRNLLKTVTKDSLFHDSKQWPTKHKFITKTLHHNTAVNSLLHLWHSCMLT